MDYKEIKYEIADHVLTITLNRPEKLNATTDLMRGEWLDALDRADEDDNVRAIIFTGAGRAYCAGADLGRGHTTWDYKSREADETIEKHRDGGGLVTLRLYDMKKPMIAAINGAAVGYGITHTLPMDIRLASENARIGFVFIRRGIVPEAASTWFLPRLVGVAAAAEWMYSGRIFDAREALTRGLVSEVLAPEALLPRARELASEIARNASPVAVALTRQLIWKMLGADHPMEAHRTDSKSVFYLGANRDAREGIQSFLEKRPPNFTMRPSQEMPDWYPWWKPRPFGGK